MERKVKKQSQPKQMEKPSQTNQLAQMPQNLGDLNQTQCHGFLIYLPLDGAI